MNSDEFSNLVGHNYANVMLPVNHENVAMQLNEEASMHTADFILKSLFLMANFKKLHNKTCS